MLAWVNVCVLLQLLWLLLLLALLLGKWVVDVKVAKNYSVATHLAVAVVGGWLFAVLVCFLLLMVQSLLLLLMYVDVY